MSHGPLPSSPPPLSHPAQILRVEKVAGENILWPAVARPRGQVLLLLQKSSCRACLHQTVMHKHHSLLQSYMSAGYAHSSVSSSLNIIFQRIKKGSIKSKKSIVVFKESNTFIFVNINCDVCSPAPLPSSVAGFFTRDSTYTGTEMGDMRERGSEL
jgi:hypothetical protein